MRKSILLLAMVIASVFFLAACGSKVASNGNAGFASGGNAAFVSGGNVLAPIATSGNAG